MDETLEGHAEPEEPYRDKRPARDLEEALGYFAELTRELEMGARTSRGGERPRQLARRIAALNAGADGIRLAHALRLHFKAKGYRTMMDSRAVVDSLLTSIEGSLARAGS